MIWDPLPRTSISVDYWKIKRKNEINQEQTDAAIAAGSVARDPTSVSGIPGDPGAITAVLTRYVNSAQTKVRGIDLDARYAHKLPRRLRQGHRRPEVHPHLRMAAHRAGRHLARIRRHPRQLRRHELHGHAGQQAPTCASAGSARLARVAQRQLPRQARQHLLPGRPGRLRQPLRQRQRCAERLRTGLLHHLRPGGALEAGAALGSLRLDRRTCSTRWRRSIR
jgi:hypothetical protein